MKALESETRQLREAGAHFARGARPQIQVVTAFIDDYWIKDAFEPIWRKESW